LCPAGVSKNIVKPVLSDGQFGTNGLIDSEDSPGATNGVSGSDDSPGATNPSPRGFDALATIKE
jgi:hypothetical protein